MPSENTTLKINNAILPIGFSIVILIMILTNIFALSRMNESSGLMVDTVKQRIYNNNLLRNMTQASFSRSILLAEMINIDDPFANDELFLKMNTHATAFSVNRAKFESQDLDTKMDNLLVEQDQLSRIVAPVQNKVYELIQLDQREKATNLFNSFALPKQNDVHKVINRMSEYQYSSAQKTFQEPKHENSKVLSSIILFDILSVLSSILLTFFVLRKQRRNEKHLTRIANTDTLTNLPNRPRFIGIVDELIEAEPDSICAILFFDIDYFKTINDNYGHATGDKILKQFAEKVSENIKDIDVLSRFGGDEFVLLLRSSNTHEKINNFVHQLSSDLDTSFKVDNNEIFLTSSIGVAHYSKDATTARALLKNADIAMYSAKKSGRNCYQYYSTETNSKIERDHTISHTLHTILKDNNKNKELFLMYQPLMNISEGGIKECEALIRWKNTEGKMIMPDEFIPLAEKSNLIEKINLFVVNEACKQQSEWQQSGINDVRINVNLSGNKLIFKKLLKQFKRNLRSMNLSPTLFGIELTERTLNDISKETIFELEEMRDLGMKIAIDDFGTDYSSLISLKDLPITTLKIDKGFIEGLPDNKDDHALVKTIITLGHSLNLDIVAEGVETFEQLQFLKEHECNIAQGFYFHRPLESTQITKLKLAA